jgi:hypothetical protein
MLTMVVSECPIGRDRYVIQFLCGWGIHFLEIGHFPDEVRSAECC